MNTASELERLEQVIDTSGVAPRLELLLPVGVRPRQLRVRTLLAGMLLIAVHGRPGVSEEPCKRDRKDWSCLHLHPFIQI